MKIRLLDNLYFLCSVGSLLWRIRGARPESGKTICDVIEHWADHTPNRPAIYFQEDCISYRELDEAANRYARWARSIGIEKGMVVAILMENRPEFIFAWLGLLKIGAVAALLNAEQRGAPLARSLTLSEARILVLGAELADTCQSAPSHLERQVEVWATGGLVKGTRDLDEALAKQSNEPIRREWRESVKGSDRAFLFYTSGTTGLPKAAVLTHARVKLSMGGFGSAMRVRGRDRMYVVLPLYHTSGGLSAIMPMFGVGGSIILRRKFSVQSFWDDCVKYRATIFYYVGELCRYLVHSPPHPLERKHRLRLIVGNGLRPDIWRRFTERFGVPRVLEIYGATEGNVNLFNFSGRPGAVGRIPPFLKQFFHVRLIRLDPVTFEPVRGSDGFCEESGPGEPGEAIGAIETRPSARFDGYTDELETEKKILKDVFKPGDRWFRSGDLLEQDEEGHFYFVDRIGDTFRWKGENVATSEVADVISAFPGIKEANVYGVQVPQTEGRAGMAALVVGDEIDLDQLADHMVQSLAPFARPQFLRLVPEMETTSTFKQRKGELLRRGFTPDESDELYFFDREAVRYVPLDAALYKKIVAGNVRF